MQIALDKIAADLQRQLVLRDGFNAFGDHTQAQLVRNDHQRLCQSDLFGAGSQSRSGGLLNLEKFDLPVTLT